MPSVLNIPLSGQDDLVAAANAPANWSCSVRGCSKDTDCNANGSAASNDGACDTQTHLCTGGEVVSQCNFKVSARRLVVEPDELKLVMFDNIKDYINPTLALYVYAHQLGFSSPITQAVTGLLCSPAHAQEITTSGEIIRRPFAVLSGQPLSCP